MHLAMKFRGVPAGVVKLSRLHAHVEVTTMDRGSAFLVMPRQTTQYRTTSHTRDVTFAFSTQHHHVYR